MMVEPSKAPPKASRPSKKATKSGAATAMTPGAIISFSAAVVAMDTQVFGSGLTPGRPSSRPGISRNWRRTSSTMKKAARPTEVMVRAAASMGTQPPTNTPTTTTGSVRLMLVRPAACTKATNRASAVNAAEPMAKPLPMAAVVLPRASSESVILRVSGPRPPISDMPPALSAMGP